eukprot:XP_014046510.1 PREDICTED: meprin A subunit beta-like [Salmo salar]
MGPNISMGGHRDTRVPGPWQGQEQGFHQWGRHHLHAHHGGCAVGDDWWYYGETCQYPGFTQDTVTTALIASFSVLGGMLVVTVASVVCVKRNHKNSGGGGDWGITMFNVSTTGM